MENNTLTLAQVTSGIYTCLEMLRAGDREDLAAWWCNLLYTDNGDINLPAWDPLFLRSMENDVIFYT